MLKTKKRPAVHHSKKSRNAKVFYCVMLAFPVLQFLICYLGVNFNSILLSLKSYNDGDYQYVGLMNFKMVIDELQMPYMKNMITNSLVVYAVNLFVGLSFCVVFSYYIYKKSLGHEFFKFILFLPSIISAVVMAILFKYFTERGVPALLEGIFGITGNGLLGNNETRFPTLLFYMIFTGFGSNILLFSGAMSGINESLVDAAKIDGVSSVQEFFHITIPMIYPTLTTLIVVSTAGIFINQFGLFNFFGNSADIADYTVGYYFYKSSKIATLAEYPRLAAMGVLFTLVSAPVTLLLKRILEKCGPSDE